MAVRAHRELVAEKWWNASSQIVVVQANPVEAEEICQKGKIARQLVACKYNLLQIAIGQIIDAEMQQSSDHFLAQHCTEAHPDGLGYQTERYGSSKLVA